MRRGTKVGWLLVALSIILSVWTMAGSFSNADGTENGFTVNDSGVLTGYNGTETVITVPSVVNNIPVTAIGSNAFGGNDAITSITLPTSITSIQSNAFSSLEGLQSVDLSATNITEISANAFDGDASLTSVRLPETLQTISSMAFNATGLGSITIPASVTSISTDAFTRTANMISFLVDANNQRYTTDDAGILYNKDMTNLVLVPGGYQGTVDIPSGVVSIGRDAFQSNSNITGVNIPSTVTTINDGAFSGTGIDSVTIPATVTYIGTQSNWNPSVIYGTENSAAQTFAQALGVSNGYTKFVAINSDNTPVTYTVTFDPNGGTGTYTTQTVASGDTASQPTTDPTRTGYTFNGWYSNGALYDFTLPVTSNLNLVALWTADGTTSTSYTVTFNSNGGSESFASQTVAAGGMATNPGSPTRTGYTFNGWYNGTSAYDFTQAVTSNLTLTARWTANSSSSSTTYRVSFNTNGGTGTFATQTVTSGNTVADPGAPTREGYTFNGWYNGSTKYDFTTPVTSNMTLRAMWTANSVASTTRNNTNGTSGTAGANGKDATPSTAGPIDARYFLCLAIFLAGVASIFYSQSTKMKYVSENRHR